MGKKRNIKLAKGIILFVVALLSLPIFNALALDKSLDIELSPKLPGPNQEVTAKVRSYSFDVDRAYITWLIDGRPVLEGLGKKSLSFKTGRVGQASVLSVSIVTDKGERLSKNKNIVPAEVDLLWYAETYVPPFYKGKPLPVPGSKIIVSAVPNLGAGVGRYSTLIYQWKFNNSNKPDKSGAGKERFVFEVKNPYEENTIKVRVSDYRNRVVAENSIKIGSFFPETVFYQATPLGGPNYNLSVGKMFVLKNKKEVTILAEPFFFSLQNERPSVSFNWFVNNNSINEGKGGILTLFNKDEAGRGSYRISVEIKNVLNYLQFVKDSFLLSFR